MSDVTQRPWPHLRRGQPSRPAAVIVLAAGEGTRMKSATAEGPARAVRPQHARARARRRARPRARTAHRRRRPRPRPGRARISPRSSPDALPVAQEEQNGTGHAVRMRPGGRRRDRRHGPGDSTATRRCCAATTLAALLATHEREGNAVTVLTADVPDPTGYGRMIRAGDGAVQRDRRGEGRRPRSSARSPRSTSGSTPSTGSSWPPRSSRVTTDNAKGEEYLTDVVAILRDDGHRVGARAATDQWRRPQGVNDRVQLAEARRAAERPRPRERTCAPESRSSTRRPPGSTST